MAPCAPKMIANKVEIDKLNDSDQPWTAIGAKVEGIMFGQAVSIMGPRLQACRKYRVSNSPIRYIKPEYRSPGLSKQWVIGIGTVVEEVNEPITTLVTKEQYTPFDSLNDFAGIQDGFVDVIVVIVERSHPQTVTTGKGKKRMIQKFCMLNEELQYVRLSLWEEFHQDVGILLTEQVQAKSYPTVICRRMLVSVYNGIEVTTSHRSVVLINPPSDKARKLRNWSQQNRNKIDLFLQNKPSFSSTPAISHKNLSQVTLVTHIDDEQHDILVKVHVEFRDIPQPFYYMACKECGTGTSATYQQDFKCNKCSLKQSATNPKCRLRANIHDDSGSIQASIFGSIAEKILGFTATEIVENPEKINLKEIHELLENKAFLLQLRGSKRMYRGIRDYNVNNLIEDDGSFLTPLLTNARESEFADEVLEDNNTEVTPIKQISDRHENITVRVYVDFKDIPQTFYYLACKNCDAGTSHMYNTPFQCTICKVKQYADNPRCRIRFNLRDNTYHLQATALGVIGEKILGVTAKQMIEEREKFDLKAIEQKLERQKYRLQLKRCPVLYEGHRDYIVVSCIEDNTPDSEMQLLLPIQGDQTNATENAAPLPSDEDAVTAGRSSTEQIDTKSHSDTNEVDVPLKRPCSPSSKVDNDSDAVADDVPFKRATKRNKKALV
ncbi:OLC1v1001398C1 [Oldenlandia corymbosa var. corymbosa]|nr:OLC1v1001398C1 [Oldenlandia corymbosa var. corymbosa]